MGRGSSGLNKNSELKNIVGVNGYKVRTANGDSRDFFFQKDDNGITYYRNHLSEIAQPTPNNMTESQLIARIKANGGTAVKYSKSELESKERQRLEDRKQTNDALTAAYIQDKIMKKGSRVSRIGNRVRRRQR